MGSERNSWIDAVRAALAVGWLRVASAFARTIVVALGSARQLALLNTAGWSSVALAGAGMWVGSAWGLTGLVLGAGVGWLALVLVATVLALPLMHAERAQHVVRDAARS